MKIWSKQPADRWEAYYPLGSGQTGAMVAGGVKQNEIVLNDDRFWSGPQGERSNPKGPKALQAIREALFAGRIAEAEEIAATSFYSNPPKESHYEYLANLEIALPDIKTADITDYSRELDLADGVYHQTWQTAQGKTQLTLFTSLIDHRLYGHFQLPNSPSTHLSFKFHRREGGGDSHLIDETHLQMTGQAKNDGPTFISDLIISGPQLNTQKTTQALGLSARDDLFFAVKIAVGDDSSKPLKALTAETFQQKLTAHLKQYHEQFQRTDFGLAVPETKNLATDERVRAQKDNPTADQYLVQLLFDFGKYLIISASQPRTHPANLQGIWNQYIDPKWGSRYTININTEMNYWLTGPLNYSDLFAPFVDLFNKAVKRGQKTAQELYGLPGSVIHHNLDIYGDGAPQSTTISSTLWPLGGIWLANEIFDHSRFMISKKYLVESFDSFVLLAKFLEAFLVLDPEGFLVAAPSLSPENYYYYDGAAHSLSYGTTLDNQLIDTFLKQLIDLSQQLHRDDVPITHWQAMRSKLRPVQLTPDKRIAEWPHHFQEVDLGHRHFSPLYGLFPGHLYSSWETPFDEKLKGAANSIGLRVAFGSGQTGWSLAWLINLYARLGASTEAEQAMRRMFIQSTQPNLLNSHPPFQIDGNFGFANAVSELLIQSNDQQIKLLPALPNTWPNGHITGIRTRTGYLVDLKWQQAKLTTVKIYHGHGPVTVLINPVYRDEQTQFIIPDEVHLQFKE